MTFSSSFSLKTNTLKLIKTKPLKTDNAQFKPDCDETAQYKCMGGGGGGGIIIKCIIIINLLVQMLFILLLLLFFNFVLFYRFKWQALKSFCNCTYCK